MIISLLALALVDSINPSLAGHVVAGRHREKRYADLRARLQAGAHQTMLWIVGLVGCGLLITGVIEYVARFVLRRS